MEVRIGDKVRFLTQTGGGKVVKIIDPKTVMVLDEDEFEIPTAVTNLVVIESDFSTESGSIKSTIIAPKRVQDSVVKKSTDKMYLAFLSKQTGNDGADVDVYLVNDTEEVVFYTFYEQNQKEVLGVGAGNCNVGEKMFVKTYSSSEISEIKNISLHLISYKLKGEPKMPIVFKFNVHPVKFFKSSSYKKNEFFDVSAMIHEISASSDLSYKLHELTHSEEKKIIAQKEKGRRNEIPVIKTKDEVLEIDLHINKLLDSVVGLSNRDILTYQLDKFTEIMEANQYKKGSRVVFIHGIGNGTLKQKILWDLDHKYKKCKHQDASYQKYGPGATLVIF